MKWWPAGLAAFGLLLAAKHTRASTLVTPEPDPPVEPDHDLLVNYSSSIRDLGAAIAYAEGFGKTGAIPTRAHNPGDLVLPGSAARLGTEGVTVFPDDDAGFAALYRQLSLIELGQSHVYTINDSILSMAGKWAPHDPHAWADNVTAWYQQRGYSVQPDTTIAELLYA